MKQDMLAIQHLSNLQLKQDYPVFTLEQQTVPFQWTHTKWRCDFSNSSKQQIDSMTSDVRFSTFIQISDDAVKQQNQVTGSNYSCGTCGKTHHPFLKMLFSTCN